MKSVLLFGAVVACGGGSSNNPQPNVVQLPTSIDAGSSAATPEHIASQEMLAAWTLAQPETLLYVDMERALVPDAVFAKLISFIGTLTLPGAMPGQMTCVRDVLLATKEIVAGAKDGLLLIARFDQAHAPPLPACMGSAAAAKVRGADEAWALEPQVVVAVSRDLIIAGTPAQVEHVIERSGEGGAALRAFPLAHDQFARLHVETGDKIDGALSVTANHLGADADVEMRTAPEAAAIVTRVNDIGSQIPRSPVVAEHDAVVRIANAIHAARQGKHVLITLALDEPVTDQLRDLSASLSFAKRGVDEYLIASKQAEARNSVDWIARDIITAWEREELPPVPRAKKKLRSFPAVPATIPRGVKVQTTPDDWKAWAPIRFEMDAPQYYQYEVRAAKDGESAVISARGDLNGDGKTSLFEMTLKVDRAHGSTIVRSTLVETNPAE